MMKHGKTYEVSRSLSIMVLQIMPAITSPPFHYTSKSAIPFHMGLLVSASDYNPTVLVLVGMVLV